LLIVSTKSHDTRLRTLLLLLLVMPAFGNADCFLPRFALGCSLATLPPRHLGLASLGTLGLLISFGHWLCVLGLNGLERRH